MTRRPPIAFTAEQDADMVRLYGEGRRCTEIAKHYGCLPGSVWNRLHKLGVKMTARPKRRRVRRHSHGYLQYGHTYIHRIVAEEMLGRPLTSGEHVHHKNHDRADNRPENLEILTASQHQRHHGKQNERWSSAEDALLFKMTAAGFSDAVIAVDVGMPSRHAVSNRRRRLIGRGWRFAIRTVGRKRDRRYEVCR